MAVRSEAAPPTPWSKNLAEPKIDSSAYVHSFSNLIGDVKVEANVLIAPGTSIRADEGHPFHIGEATNIQDGVVIHGLEQGRVKGDDGQEYSVWIGKETCITHMALIHGPAYVGDKCFIGFRSTVFNAKVGHGCIIMMHSLIQDVEIPPGKYVPSGSVITNQQQADRLPDINDSDRAFAAHVVEVNEALRAGYRCAEDVSCVTPLREATRIINQKSPKSTPVENMSLQVNIREQVRNLLAQGYTIGTEYATVRRFKTNSWLSGPSLDGKGESQIIQALEQLLSEQPDQYIRLIGIDPQAKRRASEIMIQRPGETPNLGSTQTTKSSVVSHDNGKVGTDVNAQVRSLLQQGYQIGIEYANQRRYKTSSWLTAGTINANRESEALQQLQNYLQEYAGEYVRLIGIDPQAKRRVVETIIQRPGENQTVTASSASSSNSSYSYSSAPASSSSKGSLDAEVIAQVRSLLQQGYQIGTEHADQRRFKTKSWHSCNPIDSKREAEVIRALEACLAEHQGEYVRLIGIDSKQKRRVLETIIQRPGEAKSSVAATTNTKAQTTEAPRPNYNGNGKSTSSNSLDSETSGQVRSLLAQGYKIGTEHADQRRFKTKSWHSCEPIESNRESEVIRALEACLKEHQGEYVRLLGIDAEHKRRVLETIIQRP